MEIALENASTSSSSSKSYRDMALTGGGGEEEADAVANAKQQEVRRVRRRTLQAALEQCQRALELLKDSDLVHATTIIPDEVDDDDDDDAGEKPLRTMAKNEEDELSHGSASAAAVDSEADELCDLFKSRIVSPDFLEKFESIHMSILQNGSDESTSWDVVSATDLWEEKCIDGENRSTQNGDDYVLVRQEDIVDGIACFMAAYLLSLEQTKDLTPNQLQEALNKTFSMKKKKGKLRKAWDGSKVIYNVASWGATAIGIYHNPALFKAASLAFWTSCRVVSQLF